MRTREQRFVRNSILLISIELITKLLGLFLFALLARMLGARELGVYSFGVALANLFVIAPRFGFERLAQREVGRDVGLLYSQFREISVVKAFFSFGALSLLWLLLLAIGKDGILIVMMIACFTFAYSFLEFINALFRAILKPELEIAVRTLFSVLNLSLGIGVLFAGWGLIGFVLMQVVSVATAVMLAIFMVERIAVKVRYSLDWRVLWGHVVAAAPFAGMVVALYFSHQTSIIALSALTEKEEVGYFAAGLKLLDILTLIPAAVMGAFLPMMSRLHGVSVGRFVRSLRFTLKYLFILSAPIVVGTILLARPITVLLYSESFAPSASALQMLMPALIFSFWNYAGDSIWIACNRERLLMKISWLGAVIHVTANLLLIPFFSYLGASLAIPATQFLRFILLFAFLRRYIGARTLLQSIAVPAVCVGIMAGVVFVMRDWNLILVILAGAVIYALALFASRAVHRDDMESLQRMGPGHPTPSIVKA